MSPRNARPQVTKERVFRAALQLADEEGLEALTMRRLGAELGVEAMSLYYHVPDKAAVLRGVAELVLAEIQVDDEADDHWIDALKSGFRSARRVLKAHPNVIPLLMISPGADRSSRRLAEIVLGLMAKGGIAPAEAHRAFRVLQAFLFGHALAARVRPTEEEIEAQVEELGRMEPGFPLLRAALSSPGHLDLEEDFELGVDLLLDALRRRSEASG